MKDYTLTSQPLEQDNIEGHFLENVSRFWAAHACAQSPATDSFNLRQEPLLPHELPEPNQHSGLALLIKKVQLPSLMRNERHDLQKSTRCLVSRLKRDKYCLILILSKFKFSHSAFSNKHINAIGNSYTIIVIDMRASSLFYMN